MTAKIDLKFLSSLPRNERRPAVIEYLSQHLEHSDPEQLRSEVAKIMSLGRRWSDLIHAIPNHDDVSVELKSQIQKYIVDRSVCDLVVDYKDTGIGRWEIEKMLSNLEAIDASRQKSNLRVTFDTENVYIYGLCAIAAWASQNAETLDFLYVHDRVKYFLQRAGVIEALGDPKSDPVKFDRTNFIGFTRIDPTLSSDAHAGRLVGLLSAHVDMSDQTAQALGTCFAELIENSIKHGEITSPAWLFANYHPEPQYLHVCICDRGIGIQKSFSKSENKDISDMARESEIWIKRATDALVTSKKQGHAGYGLFVVRELCRLNKGQFLLISGPASYRLTHRLLTTGELREEESTYLRDVKWKGTFLGIMLNLQNPVDLAPIYKNLPSPRGYEDEDLDLFDE